LILADRIFSDGQGVAHALREPRGPYRVVARGGPPAQVAVGLCSWSEVIVGGVAAPTSRVCWSQEWGRDRIVVRRTMESAVFSRGSPRLRFIRRNFYPGQRRPYGSRRAPRGGYFGLGVSACQLAPWCDRHAVARQELDYRNHPYTD
jgi:hypothetical protein